MEVFYNTKFLREYKKLPPDIKNLAEKQEEIFRNNPFDFRLKTHKLHGWLNEFLAFSINSKYRIVFKLDVEKKIAYFYSVGDHSVYQ